MPYRLVLLIGVLVAGLFPAGAAKPQDSKVLRVALAGTMER